jgi:hypothetical protein
VPEHVQSYAQAARRPIGAGFDGVELHGANGYLISQFLSSDANLRTGRYPPLPGRVVLRSRGGLRPSRSHEATYYQGGDTGHLTYSTYQYTA